MTKSIQSSFAAKIGKTKTLHNTLLGFTGYQPSDNSLTTEGIGLLISDLYSIQENHAACYNAFTAAVHARRNLFEGERPLKKIMTMVKSYVAATYGEQSDKAQNINGIVTRIRGEKPIKVTTATGESSISRSALSYGAQHVNLLYLISTLSGFGSSYAPANPHISIDGLSTLAEQMHEANKNAVLTYRALHPVVIRRREAFKELSTIAQRVKQMVLSQYGSGSLEYKSIKGIDFRVL